MPLSAHGREEALGPANLQGPDSIDGPLLVPHVVPAHRNPDSTVDYSPCPLYPGPRIPPLMQTDSFLCHPPFLYSLSSRAVQVKLIIQGQGKE